MPEAEVLAAGAAWLGYLLARVGRSTAYISLVAIAAACMGRSTDVIEQPGSPLHFRFYHWDSGVRIRTPWYALHWEKRR